MIDPEMQKTFDQEQEYVERLKNMLDEKSRKNLELFDKLHDLLVFDPAFVDKNKTEVPDSIQKEVIFEFGAIIGEYYRNGNRNVSGNSDFYTSAIETIWECLVGSWYGTHGYPDQPPHGTPANADNDHDILIGSEIFERTTLEETKRDLQAIEANLVLGLTYCLSEENIIKCVSIILSDNRREALMLAHYRISARIAEWCCANSEMIYYGEKVQSKFAEAYRQTVTSE